MFLGDMSAPRISEVKAPAGEASQGATGLYEDQDGDPITGPDQNDYEPHLVTPFLRGWIFDLP